MNHIDVNDEFVNSLFENAGWERFGVNVERKTSDKPSLSESVEYEEDLHEHEEEGYACPLCESDLEEPLDEERIAEHIDTVLTLVSESLNEENEEEVEYEEEIPLA